MACLLKCCLCIPLEPACYIIGILYIVIHLIWLEEHIDNYVRYEEREGKHRHTALQILHISGIVLAALETLLGVFIIFVTCKKTVSGLKMCACGAGVTAILDFISRLSVPVLGRPLTPYVLTLVIFLYLAIAVFSYGLYLEEERCDSATPSAATSPQLPTHPWHQEPVQQPNTPTL